MFTNCLMLWLASGDCAMGPPPPLAVVEMHTGIRTCIIVCLYAHAMPPGAPASRWWSPICH